MQRLTKEEYKVGTSSCCWCWIWLTVTWGCLKSAFIVKSFYYKRRKYLFCGFSTLLCLSFYQTEVKNKREKYCFIKTLNTKHIWFLKISVLKFLSQSLQVSITSVGGIMVSITAFQAVDPGSIPGHPKYFDISNLWISLQELDNCLLASCKIRFCF